MLPGGRRINKPPQHGVGGGSETLGTRRSAARASKGEGPRRARRTSRRRRNDVPPTRRRPGKCSRRSDPARNFILRPAGRRRTGRIAFVEHAGTWEPCARSTVRAEKPRQSSPDQAARHGQPDKAAQTGPSPCLRQETPTSRPGRRRASASKLLLESVHYQKKRSRTATTRPHKRTRPPVRIAASCSVFTSFKRLVSTREDGVGETCDTQVASRAEIPKLIVTSRPKLSPSTPCLRLLLRSGSCMMSAPRRSSRPFWRASTVRTRRLQ